RGISETPSRSKIFTCRPDAKKREGTAAVCARDIIARLSSQAFRRPASERDVDALMALYQKGDGFEDGVRLALEGILASPRLVFAFEENPPAAGAREGYAISDIELASRLSFFLWATGPDDELLRLAEQGRLSAPATLKAQVRRLLADRRADALASR